MNHQDGRSGAGGGCQSASEAVSPTAAPSVLVIHPGGLGDVLLSLPAIGAIRRRYPAHQLILLSRPDMAQLLQMCGVVDGWRGLDSGDLASLMAGVGCLEPAFRRLLESCVMAVAWLRDSDGSLRTTLRNLGVSRIAVGAPRGGGHQSQRFLETLGEFASSLEPLPPLVLPTSLKESAERYLRQQGIERLQGYVACHPGSGSVHKCVRPEIIACVIEMLSKQGFSPLIISGPADAVVTARLRHCLKAPMAVMEDQPLPMVAGMLALAKLYVGHDSGVTHLAAALGIPTVAIFGPTDPEQWKPLGPHVTIVTGQSCSCRTWDQVQQCSAKPCLSLAPEAVLTACSAHLD
jgi:heptosyltransferase III